MIMVSQNGKRRNVDTLSLPDVAVAPDISLVGRASSALAERLTFVDNRPGTGTDPMAQRLAALVGDRTVGDAVDATTDHAWLVVLGYFAQALNLVEAMMDVPLPQQEGPVHSPQRKLLEFLVGILGGIESLQDLNKDAQPIAADATIAEAWAQKLFAHYSGVSRTLAAADEDTLTTVVAVLRAISRPFIETAVLETLKEQGYLVADADLTGREVSPTSTDYEGATFGHMDGDLKNGYQAAVTSLVCARWQRLLLSIQRYTGRTQSAACLQAAVTEMEEVLGVRPRRRVEKVRARRQEQAARLRRRQERLDGVARRQQALWQRIQRARKEIERYQTAVENLSAEYKAKGREERPYSKLAKKRRQLASAQKRERRAWEKMRVEQGKHTRQQARVAAAEEALLALDEWLAQLEADNVATPNPVPILLRVDAGFSKGPQLTWLIEMGYDVVTKACHDSITAAVRRRLPDGVTWTDVGRNAAAVSAGAYRQNKCPYPLHAMLVRYHLPDRHLHTTLFYYADHPPPPLPEWFATYNARQTIEAGIKESKGVFTLKRHLVRSPVGMALQEQFALFGANFVRWAAAWVKDRLQAANRSFTTALEQVKTLVRVAGRCRARWVRNALGHTLIFDESGPFAGTVLCLSGRVAIQLPLPLFKSHPL